VALVLGADPLLCGLLKETHRLRARPPDQRRYLGLKRSRPSEAPAASASALASRRISIMNQNRLIVRENDLPYSWPQKERAKCQRHFYVGHVAFELPKVSLQNLFEQAGTVPSVGFWCGTIQRTSHGLCLRWK